MQFVLVATSQGGVPGLDRQFPHTVEHVVDFGQGPFSGLDDADPVLGVPDRLFHTADLGAHLLGDGQPCGIVPSPVNPQTGRKPFQAFAEAAVGNGQLPMSVHC